MRKLFSSGMVVFAAGIVCIPVTSTLADTKVPPANSKQSDPRLSAIRNVFEENECPAADYAAVFLDEADRHHLDWRLLPSLSMVESTGGKWAQRNNYFGWDSGRASFPSISNGIHTVAQRLSRAPQYRDKDTSGILTTYNPNPEYAVKVQSVMRKFSSAQRAAQ